jgi:hypothetical protein
VLLDRVELPVRRAEDGAVVEAEEGELLERELQQVGEVLVGLLLPAGRPDELVALGEACQAGSRGRRDVMGNSVDQSRRAWQITESKEAQDPVDVDE